MPSKPIAGDVKPQTAAEEPEEREAIGVGATVAAGPALARQTADTPSSEDDGGEDDDDDGQPSIVDDDDDEDLIAFTAREAAGALATVSSFTWPFLRNYKSLIVIVGLGLMVETLLNVIMPLSLKYLIDDALGEEDFQALYIILGVLAGTGIVTSLVAVLYERTDTRLSASVIADVRQSLFEHMQNLSAAYFSRTKRGEILARFSVDVAAYEGAIKYLSTGALLPLFELVAGICLLLYLNW